MLPVSRYGGAAVLSANNPGSATGVEHMALMIGIKGLEQPQGRKSSLNKLLVLRENSNSTLKMFTVRGENVSRINLQI